MSELSYREANGIFYPELDLPEIPEGDIGKYGLLHMEFLQNHDRAGYRMLAAELKLTEYLMEIDRDAREMAEALRTQYLQRNPLPETNSTMALARHRNQIEAEVEAVVLREIVHQPYIITS